jgi:hypothetical protein
MLNIDNTLCHIIIDTMPNIHIIILCRTTLTNVSKVVLNVNINVGLVGVYIQQLNS